MITLVDTSVWVDHFRHGNAKLRELLQNGEAATHPMILGELACGNLARREETLHLLRRLPQVSPVPDSAVLELIELRRLWGKGTGWIDAHLVAAAVSARVALFTLDRRLAGIAKG
ncbi:MAG: PIN domain-containing protein [Bryobacteraceae bacterium]